LFLLISLLLSSCLPSPVNAAQLTPKASTAEAAIIQTVVGNFAQQTATAPTNTATPTPTETPTGSLTPTLTSTPTNTSTIQLPVAPSIPCYSAAFIEDLTIPDGTQITAGTDFTKTWRLQNTGSCVWTTDYQVLFDNGDLLGGPSSFTLPNFVNPGQTVDISVNLTAPHNTGTYEGFWKLEAPNGTIFGLGSSNVDFDVLIVVGNTPVPFEVREIDLNVNNNEITTSCPPGNKFTISADIRTNGSGELVYFWEFSNDTRPDEHTITFDDSRRRTVTTTFTADHTDNFWARLHIDQPEDMRSDRVFFSLTYQTPTPADTRTPTRTPTETFTPSITPTPSNTPTKKPTE
jgi:hypothetical protein